MRRSARGGVGGGGAEHTGAPGGGSNAGVDEPRPGSRVAAADGTRAPGGRAAAVARNALSGGGRFAVAAVLALAVTPYALHALGAELFGLWALAGAMLATVRVLDLGLNRALVRTVATAAGQDRLADAAPAVGTAQAFMLALGAIVLAAVWWLRFPLVANVLAVPADLWADGRYVLLGAALVAAIEGAFAPFQAGLDGVGRMDLSNGVDTVQRVLSALGTVFVLAAGWGLVGLVWKNVLTVTLAGIAYMVLLRRHAPVLGAARPRLDAVRARELLTFGRHVQTIALSALAMDVVGKVILSRLAGLGAVAAYEVATRVAAQVGGALMAVAMALFPAAAEACAAARTGDAALLVVYRRGSRYLAWLALPAFGLLIALAQPFAVAWLGPEYGPVGRSMAVLAAGWLVATLAVPAHLVAQAGGRASVSTFGALVTTAVALTLAALLARPAGLDGVVMGMTAGLIAGALAVWWRFARAYAAGWGTIAPIGWRAPAGALCGALAARAALGLLGWLAGGSSGLSVTWPVLGGALGTAAEGGSPAALAAVFGAGLVGVIVFAAVLVGTGEAGPADRALVRSVLRSR